VEVLALPTIDFINFNIIALSILTRLSTMTASAYLFFCKVCASLSRENISELKILDSFVDIEST
jgi:hypothetical protein